MALRVSLFLASIVLLLAFTVFSYTVAKEKWQKADFDTTVKLQDHISRKWDLPFSYFSLIGSAEVTFLVAGVLAVFSLIRLKWLAFIGWLLIVPASFFEIFGKLFLYHPGPPAFLIRNVLAAKLPSFYVQTSYSYPSGHVTRTIFLSTVLIIILLTGKNKGLLTICLLGSLILLAVMMVLTRVYLGEHWLSDVLGGGLLGLASGLFATVLILKRSKKETMSKAVA